MIGVNMTRVIRRAHFEDNRTIKEIVRTLSVSLGTVTSVFSV
jgi:hypothetical protein